MFALLSEELGLIIAVTAMLALIALALFADRLGEGEFLAVHAGDGEVGAGVAHLAAHRLRGIGVEEVVVDERSDEHRRHEHIDDRL